MLASERTDRKILIAAHFLYAAHCRVTALVVYSCAYSVKHLVAFAVDVFRQKQPALCVGGKQELPYKTRRVPEYVLIIRQKLTFRKACEKADALDFAHPAHKRLNGSAVKLIKPCGNGVHIGIADRSPAEDERNERVHRRRFPRQLCEHRNAHTGGFEFERLQIIQRDAVHYLCS